MFEITRVESIDAKPSDFHEVHEYVFSIADGIDRAVVRLFDKEAGIRISVYYYLTEGRIMVLWGDNPYPRHVWFERGDLESMHDGFDEAKDLVERAIHSEQS